ncbi:MAG TPA: CysB family HTH-type transcriptional regulator [Candidatus Acidoferrum sp.]|nr:CysB family HTH-type transcriptional regulator [Candidatus Acidoferrum sp.]
MNFQQLRIIRETVRCNYNLTEVASRLFTSQSGVSKHIKDLEDELGIELFERKGKRLLGMTAPGRELAKIVDRMLLDAQNIKQLAEQYSHQDQGLLTVATTHTQARYMLPTIVAQFRLKYPKVKLHLHQGSPQEIAQLLLEGRADIGIATETIGNVEGLLTFPFHSWHHAVVVPAGHALEKQVAKLHKQGKKLTLQAIAAYPVVTYHEGFTGRTALDKAFHEAGLTPDIVLSALDADIIKSYVELGLGIGIVASLAFDAGRDTNLRLLDCTHLFPANVTRIAVREGQLQRQFADDFIALCRESGNTTRG